MRSALTSLSRRVSVNIVGKSLSLSSSSFSLSVSFALSLGFFSDILPEFFVSVFVSYCFYNPCRNTTFRAAKLQITF